MTKVTVVKSDHFHSS